MNKRFIGLLVIFFLLYFLTAFISEFYIDYEWFRINEGLTVFWVLFFTKFNVHILFSVIFVFIFFLNFIIIKFLAGKGGIFSGPFLQKIQSFGIKAPKKVIYILFALALIFISFLMGSAASSFWKEYLMYKNAVPFDPSKFPVDPIFGLNIGFYVFSLPFYQFLYGWFMSALFVIGIFALGFHFFNGGFTIRGNKVDISPFTRAHLSTIIALIVFLNGVSYRLSAYELLFSKIGKFFGAGYTAVNANLLAYNVAMIISFIAAGLLLFNIFKKSFKLPLLVLAALIPAYIILGTIYPGLQQRFIVDPNELDKEKPYIEHNIKFTRLGYDIARVKEVKFANKSNLTYNDIIKNRNTLNNVRLWDYRPLKQTYKQLQELKPYYFFNDVDVDRYMIENRKIAVNLSARELSINRLAGSSQTWVNSHLIYTHGYGLVLSRVDKITPEGQPEMLVYDIPPKEKIKLEINRPEIYYGEHNNSYVITNTTIKPGEFDYPFGDENKYTTYRGRGGTMLDSFFKRLMFAAAFKDINLLISGNVKNSSRILYKRNIMDIVRALTPFLEFDNDPYLFLSDGKLYWMIDAYTITDQFPYSNPIVLGRNKNVNYIRNSVKIIIDAYNGKVNYYIADSNDPLIKTYSNIFPNFFRGIKEMPEKFRKHIRYPEDLFTIQSHILLRYHMTNANVFYNNEDAWHVPRQIYEGKEEPVRSYYLVTNLPGEKRDEFILIIPFTPYKKNNMIAFLTAKCDMENYGELILYSLPKEKLSYGPLQIEARIDQDPEISKQLTLWSQKGSSVIRGNMLVIPIEESLIFIEPLYLKAESSEMPELKKVIVSFAENVVMENSLDDALQKIFYGKASIALDKETPTGTYSEQLRGLIERAHLHFNQAEQNMKAGDWARYGEELRKLKETLIQLKKIKKSSQQ